MRAFVLPRKPIHLPRSKALPQVQGTGVNNSYIVTNRSDPPYSSDWPWDEANNIVPLANGGMSWYVSTAGINDPTVKNYQSLSSDAFAKDIVDQLNQQADPQITVFIHGLGTEWTYAINDTAVFGGNLLSDASYQGLVIGFDWPSFGTTASLLYYASAYPPSGTSGYIRDNINGSVAAFQAFVTFLMGLRSSISNTLPRLKINLVCHSEGNYMTMLGLSGESNVSFDEVVLLAADINNGAFQTPSSGGIGQAAIIASLATRVTVYYSNNDDVLAGSEFSFQSLHNPAYSGRLGQTGPAYNQGTQQSNMYSVDCSLVVNETNSAIPSNVSLHTSYLVLSQVVQDIAATLSGTAASSVAGRTATKNTNDYVMQSPSN